MSKIKKKKADKTEKITLKHIIREIKSIREDCKVIKKLVIEDLQVDLKDLNLDYKDLKVDEKGTQKQKKIFECLEDWQNHVWENCVHRKMVQGTHAYRFNCRLLNGACKFEGCPLNYKKEEKK